MKGCHSAEATRRFYALGSRGLLVDDSATLRDFQVPYARPVAEVAGWSDGGPPGLAEVVARVRPTMLIGTSTQAGAFTEDIVREMAAHTPRPLILPLSNPTSKAEARPEDVLVWTEGRALVATGSPFPPVAVGGTLFTIAQANNALVFPGLGLGVVVAQATRITDSMIVAAADAVARLSDASSLGAPLLPGIDELRTVSAAVAVAVALAAERDGVARAALDDPIQQVHRAMWRPEYPRVRAITDELSATP